MNTNPLEISSKEELLKYISKILEEEDTLDLFIELRDITRSYKEQTI